MLVTATFLIGVSLKRTGPTIVSTDRFAIACLTASLSFGSAALPSAANATSQIACEYPIGCVHCLPVEFSQSVAISRAVWPVIDDLYGNFGVHQTSVDIPSPRGPSAVTVLAKRNAAATVQTWGLYPAWAAWFQKVAQWLGSTRPETISALPFLKAVT